MYGCYNRPPLATQQVLYGLDSLTNKQIKVVIPHRMTTECQYQKFDPYNDPGCVGCIHQQPKENHE